MYQLRKGVENMASNQRFDFNQANNFKSQLEQEGSKIEADLTRMVSKVEGIRAWWSGGSEEAFIENFKQTKTKIVTSLNEVIGNYKTLVDSISTAKSDSDADIARQLRK